MMVFDMEAACRNWRDFPYGTMFFGFDGVSDFGEPMEAEWTRKKYQRKAPDWVLRGDVMEIRGEGDLPDYRMEIEMPEIENCDHCGQVIGST